MTPEELNEARTNPEFLNYLEQTRNDAIASEDIEALYEVLDSLLILDLEEEKINSVYEAILKISFEQVETIVNSNKLLTLEGKELYYVRSFYEHAIEKWTYDDFKGASELLFVLSNIIDDEMLKKALSVHLVALAKEYNMDRFYEEKVNINSVPTQQKYAYFIDSFQFDIDEFLTKNDALLKEQQSQLQYLLD